MLHWELVCQGLKADCTRHTEKGIGTRLNVGAVIDLPASETVHVEGVGMSLLPRVNCPDVTGQSSGGGSAAQTLFDT